MGEATESRGGLALWKKMDKVWEDLYEGRGKENPSLTTRMVQIEDCFERMEGLVKESAKNSSDMKKYAFRTFVSVLTALVVSFICFKMGWAKP